MDFDADVSSLYDSVRCEAVSHPPLLVAVIIGIPGVQVPSSPAVTRGMDHASARRDGRGDTERLSATRRECSLYTSFSQAGHAILETRNGAEAGDLIAAQACGCSSVANQSAVYPGLQGRSTRPFNPSGLQSSRSACSMDRLPNELLCAIFNLCGSPNPASGYPRQPPMHDLGVDSCNPQPYSEMAVLLGHVCSRWLAVTRNCPALWTLADIGYPGQKGVNILALCLKYSAGLPIALQIYDSPPWDSDDNHRLMPLIAVNAPRWKELSIDLMDGRNALKPLLGLPAGCFTSLTKAHIRIWHGIATASSPDTLLWLSILTSPSLRHANLTKSQHVGASLTVAPFHRLTSLGLRLKSPDLLSPILDKCLEHLEVLMLYGDGADPSDTWSSGSLNCVCLPRLKSFMLSHSASGWTSIFKRLVVPALVRLEIFHGSVRWREIEDMIRRSSASIGMLAFHTLPSSQADNIIALIRSPTLRSLRILRCDRCGKFTHWEEVAFDFTPYIPPYVAVFTTKAMEAEAAYKALYI